jgi:glutamate-1-semialdehyde 2,1-aminomutase
VLGKPCCLTFRTLGPDFQPSQAFLLQETIKRGVLMPSLILGYAHGDGDIDQTIQAVDAALDVYARALSDGVENHLVGRPSQIVYRAYNSP